MTEAQLIAEGVNHLPSWLTLVLFLINFLVFGAGLVATYRIIISRMQTDLAALCDRTEKHIDETRAKREEAIKDMRKYVDETFVTREANNERLKNIEEDVKTFIGYNLPVEVASIKVSLKQIATTLEEIKQMRDYRAERT